MCIFIIVCMFIATLYAVTEIKGDNRKATTEHLTSASCFSIALVTSVFDLACLYLIVFVFAV